MHRASGLLCSSLHPRLAAGASPQPTVGRSFHPRAWPSPLFCTVHFQLPSSFLSQEAWLAPGSGLPTWAPDSGLRAPAQLTIIDFYSASRLQKHALEPKPAKSSCCSFCVSWTMAVPSRDSLPPSTDSKIILTSPMSYTLAMLVRG